MDFKEQREKLLALTKKKIAESLKADTHIIQALCSADDLTTQINGLAKRVREWHGYYLPEAGYYLRDNEHFINFISDKTYEELIAEYGKGMDAKVEEKDYAQLQRLAKMVQGMFEEKDKLLDYISLCLESTMKNIKELAGVTIAARLLAGAGSLERLAKLPASTIQMLGAEKALFRHLRSGARSPKHGHIFNHPIVQAANKQRKSGKAARMLADKLSICAKLDYFKGEFLAPEYKKTLEKFWGVEQ